MTELEFSQWVKWLDKLILEKKAKIDILHGNRYLEHLSDKSDKDGQK